MKGSPAVINALNETLRLEQEDNETREVFENLMKGSEKHVQWLESQLTLIRQVGLENYAARQIGE